MKRPLKSAAAAFVREEITRRLLPASVASDLNRNDRAGAMHRAWGYVYTNQIRGAYYELGVYRGDGFRASFKARKLFDSWLCGQLASPEIWRRTVAAGYADYAHPFYAFDTFAGMPANEEGNPCFAEGNFGCSLTEFRRLNEAAGLKESGRVRYFAGTFDETLKREPEAVARLEPAAIANVDCDLYGSTLDALRILAPKLRQGTVVLMDDWNAFSASDRAGERQALAEFSAEHAGLSFEPWFPYEFVGQAFLVHKKD